MFPKFVILMERYYDFSDFLKNGQPLPQKCIYSFGLANAAIYSEPFENTSLDLI